MPINLNRFVEINIAYHTTSSVNSIRDTAVLFTDEGTNGTVNTYTSIDAISTTLVNSLKYAKTFFMNGGNKLEIHEGITLANLETEVKKLTNDKIVIAYCNKNGTFSNDEYSKLQTLANNQGEDATISSKIYLARTNVTTDTSTTHNFAVKYSNEVGAEMTMAAYLTSIDINGNNTVNDYCYTVEYNISEATDDDTVYGACLTNNLNVDLKLAGDVVNVGGNLKDGLDLVNTFMLIVCQQTTTEQLIDLLKSKIKGDKGIAAITSRLSHELIKYVNNGYLTTDEIWTDEDWKVTKNNVTYTIISKNTPLTNGFYITTLPLSSLTAEDKQKRKAPDIYLVLSDSYGIRMIEITGEVI